MPIDMIYTSIFMLYGLHFSVVLCLVNVIYGHIGVGLQVARSTVMGNLRASRHGTSKDMVPTSFFVVYAEMLKAATHTEKQKSAFREQSTQKI